MNNIKRYTAYPVKIAALSDDWKNPESLLKEKPLQIGLNEPEVSETDNGWILLDFGIESSGSIRILTYTAEKNMKIRIRTGESVGEAMSDIGERGSCNDHSPRDITAEIVGLSDLNFIKTGFRFVRIDFFGKARIKSIVADCMIFSKEPVYRYSGTDKEITQIFNTAKRTVDLCMSSGYIWDGVKRDRLVWIGDMYPEMLAAVTLYGRIEEVENSLDFVRDQYPLPSWMNGFPSYSMWWIIILADYYKETDCTDYIAKNIDYLKKLLAYINDFISDDGEMSFPQYFLDWPTCDTPDAKHGVWAVCMAAAAKSKELLDVFSEDSNICKTIECKLNKRPPVDIKSKQAIAVKYFATGEISEKEADALTKGGAKGMSTFMSWFILKAIAETAGTETAVCIMKEYYSGMLKMGATTFWEDFDIEWTKNACTIDRLPDNDEKDIHGDFGQFCYKGFRHSLCHGWSAGVIPFIKKFANNT